MNDWFEKYRTLILTVIGLGILAAIIVFGMRWQPAESITIIPPQPTPTPGPIRVYVSGAVAQADVYTLPNGAIAQDAIEAAGGSGDEADLSRLNLARPLKDGEQVYVPSMGETAPPQSETGGADEGDEGEVVISGPININIATQAELETLPGIGPKRALDIISYREEHGPFETIEDIQNVSGIGPSVFEDIKDLITVG